MQVRPLRPEDAQGALDLRVVAFSSGMHVEHDGSDVYVPDDRRLVAIEDDRVVGHFAAWPFAQSFGGRAVPMGGVGGVVVAHDARARGIGSALLGAGLELMAAHGQHIATLYPSTPAPYRAWGWEVAGEHVRRTIATRELLDLPRPSPEIRVRGFELDDLDEALALHNGVTLHEPGGLQAPRLWFERFLTPDPDEPELALVATRDDAIVGLLLATKVAGTAPHDAFGLRVLWLLGADGDAELALWHNLASHHSVCSTITCNSQPADPLQFVLPRTLPDASPTSHLWMTRLVDAPAAVAARGWPPIRAACPLVVHDRRRTDNDGAWMLEVVDGEAAMTPHDQQGGPTIDIGALSSMYTGFATPRALARAGRLVGATTAQLDALTAMFAGTAPFLRDYF